MRMDTAGTSQPGGRKNNQDSYGFEQVDHSGCWVVADGLGGHAGGETASRMAVAIVLDQFRAAPDTAVQSVAACFQNVQKAIQHKAAEDLSLAGMRTTMVMLTCSQEKAAWGHVGDSRLYWFRQGRILHQTRDHSVPQMLVDAGKIDFQDIRGHEDQNRLTRAMGQEGEIRPTLLPELFSVQAGDAALLCSDGVWTYVLEQEMEEDLTNSASATDWLNRLEQRVLARAEGSYDNYTAVAVLFQGVLNA